MNALQHRTAALALSMLHGAWPNAVDQDLPVEIAAPLINTLAEKILLNGMSTDEAIAKLAMGLLTHLSRMTFEPTDTMPDIAAMDVHWREGHTPNMGFTTRTPVNRIEIDTSFSPTPNPAEGEERHIGSFDYTGLEPRLSVEKVGRTPEEPPTVGDNYDPDAKPTTVPVISGQTKVDVQYDESTGVPTVSITYVTPLLKDVIAAGLRGNDVQGMVEEQVGRTFSEEESANFALGIDSAIAAVESLDPEKPQSWEEFYQPRGNPRAG